jgi:hypothetical protein
MPTTGSQNGPRIDRDPVDVLGYTVPMRVALLLNGEDARRVAELRERFGLVIDGAAIRLALRIAHEACCVQKLAPTSIGALFGELLAGEAAE